MWYLPVTALLICEIDNLYLTVIKHFICEINILYLTVIIQLIFIREQ